MVQNYFNESLFYVIIAEFIIVKSSLNISKIYKSYGSKHLFNMMRNLERLFILEKLHSEKASCSVIIFHFFIVCSFNAFISSTGVLNCSVGSIEKLNLINELRMLSNKM